MKFFYFIRKPRYSLKNFAFSIEQFEIVKFCQHFFLSVRYLANYRFDFPDIFQGSQHRDSKASILSFFGNVEKCFNFRALEIFGKIWQLEGSIQRHSYEVL